MTDSFYIDVLNNDNSNPYNNIYFNNTTQNNKSFIRKKYNLNNTVRFNTNLTNKTIRVSSTGTGRGSKLKMNGFKNSKYNRYNNSNIFLKKPTKKIKKPKINKKSNHLNATLKLSNNIMFNNDFKKGLITQKNFKNGDLLFILFKKINNDYELTPIGDTVNFSNEPNTGIKRIKDTFFAKATRDISKSEEITSSFNGLPANMLKYKLE